MNKIRNWQLATALLIAVCTCMLFMLRDLRRDKDLDPFRDQILKDQIALSKIERDSLDKLSKSFKIKADSLLSEINKIKKKSKKTDEKYVQDLATWRALPADRRAKWFSDELSRVDSIPNW